MQGLWKYLKEGATGFASGSDVGVRERGGPEMLWDTHGSKPEA